MEACVSVRGDITYALATGLEGRGWGATLFVGLQHTHNGVGKHSRVEPCGGAGPGVGRGCNHPVSVVEGLPLHLPLRRTGLA